MLLRHHAIRYFVGVQQSIVVRLLKFGSCGSLGRALRAMNAHRLLQFFSVLVQHFLENALRVVELAVAQDAASLSFYLLWIRQERLEI